MLFANARIAMNDVYVTTFVLLAALLFAPLYLAPRRPWTALALLVGAGLALGLALASKWVALYAIGGFGLLVLFRSALGRTIALTAMMAMTAVLGSMAIRPAPVEDPVRNWMFVLLMLLLTGLLAAAAWEVLFGIGNAHSFEAAALLFAVYCTHDFGERAYMLVALGYPADDCEVPDLTRKPLSDILTTY